MAEMRRIRVEKASAKKASLLEAMNLLTIEETKQP